MTDSQLPNRPWWQEWAPMLALLGGMISATFYIGGELKHLDHLQQGQLRLEGLIGELRDEQRDTNNNITNMRERVSVLEAKQDAQTP